MNVKKEHLFTGHLVMSSGQFCCSKGVGGFTQNLQQKINGGTTIYLKIKN